MNIRESLVRLSKEIGLGLPNGLLVGLSMLGLAAVYSEQEANKLRKQATEIEALKALPPNLREEIKQVARHVCTGLKEQDRKIWWRNNVVTGEEGVRVLRLEGFKAMLSCAEFLHKEPVLTDEVLKKMVINYGSLCVQINDGFVKNSKGFHPILWRFYNSLQGKLCQPYVIQRLEEIKKEPTFQGFGLQIESMVELIKKLDSLDNAKKTFSIFEAKRKKDLNIFCIKVLDTVVANDKDLQRVINFILNHKSKIKDGDKFPQLKLLLADLEDKAAKKNVTLEDHLIIKSGLIQTAAGTICTSEAGVEKIREKETAVFPIFKEVAELLVGDESKEAKELEVLFLRIFNKVKDF